MANKFVSSRISPELEKTLEDYCKSNNTTKSVVLIEALHEYLNLPKPVVNEKISEVPGVTIEMFTALQNEVKDLAKSQEEIKNLILNYNTRNEIPEETKIDDNIIDNSDNNNTINDVIVIDNKGDDVIVIDNKGDNVINAEKSYKEIMSSEVSGLTNIPSQYVYKLHEKAIRILEKAGLKDAKDNLLEKPIEVEYKDGIFIENSKYRLFYIGKNSKGKAMWELIPDDKQIVIPN